MVVMSDADLSLEICFQQNEITVSFSGGKTMSITSPQFMRQTDEAILLFTFVLTSWIA
jgi:hypothetical protein